MLIVFVTNDFKIGILFHCSKIDIHNVDHIQRRCHHQGHRSNCANGHDDGDDYAKTR